LSQSQLSELTRRVLGVDEEGFKEVTREFAREELLMEHDTRRRRLADAGIVLGSVEQVPVRRREYEAVAEVPLCRERHGDGKGVFRVVLDGAWGAMLLYLEHRCEEDADGASGRVEDICYVYGGKAYTEPHMLYALYEFLYKELGTGARPLLELARKAEEEGGGDVAGVLKKVYAILEASKDIIEEIEKADYSGVVAELEREAEKRVERAIKLLREAKEVAGRGDTSRLKELLYTPVFEVGGRTETGVVVREHIWLDDIIDELYKAKHRPRAGGKKEDAAVPEHILKEEDIYEAILTVAEHFGLEVEP